jgi:excisionase family DNA binding protein
VEQFLTLSEAAKIVRLSRSQLYNLATAGEVPCRQLNGHGKLLFKLSELEAALQPKCRRSTVSV